MNWNALDWPTLEKLRERFLKGAPGEGPYWQSENELAAYNLTYGERIGWKWDAVLRELHARRWRPKCRTLLDWACGSGIAGRRVLAAFGGSAAFDRLQLWDHAPLARAFAEDQARAAFPEIDIQGGKDPAASDAPIGLLLISHVLNELSPSQREQLCALVSRAEALIWVEPGTHSAGRELAALRDHFANTFHIVAPCPHTAPCGLFAKGREQDWCHFFAQPPPALPANPNWVRFAQKAGIDLRSLPYSFLVLDREQAPPPPRDAGRILGRPRISKPSARFLACEADGLTPLELPKRIAPAIVKSLGKHPPDFVYRWKHSGGRITEIEAPHPPAKSPPPA